MDSLKITNDQTLLRILGHLGMLALLCLAWVFWLERSTTYDSSLYSYMLITREAVYTPHDRMINYLWQWIPILSLKMGLSLKTFMYIMSLAPILFLYAVYCLISYGLKNALAGLYMILCLVVLTRYKFYSAIPEIYLGSSFVALMIAWLTQEKHQKQISSNWKNILIGLGIVSLCFLGHPLMFIPLCVVLGFDYLMKQDWKSVPHFVLVGFAAVLFLIKYLQGRGSAHEGKVIVGFFDNISGVGHFQ